MPANKVTAKKGKSESAARARHNPEGVMRVWGDGDPAPSGENGNGTKARSAARKRNPAELPNESKEVRKANDLMLKAWERIYAKRDKFGNPA